MSTLAPSRVISSTSGVGTRIIFLSTVQLQQITTIVVVVVGIADLSKVLFDRLMWLALLVTGTAVLVLQVVMKMDAYNSNPIVTNIDMAYLSSLTFPTVAICNSNQYRYF